MDARPMKGARFEELAWRSTPLGEISLRRRIDPALRAEVFEVKLGDEYLMSSLFTVAEVELARLALAARPHGGVDMVVGGLGLGCTADAALADERVRSLIVVDALDDVIGWHRDGLLPLSAAIVADPRCRLVHGDFFALTAGAGFDPDAPARRFHVIAVDIDHSPRHLLSPGHADFYTEEGLRRLRRHLHPGGVFALWSDDPPDAAFTTVLEAVFATSTAHVVTFANPVRGGESSNTVYVAVAAS
ncbi:spermidine synthase [Virgisporangium ochraceum]|uniref:Spermidine synthase n=1 Tax=Virgisporangium ochraceum TaxID=65505 RepID=A0A8J4EE03_9ACTN|nr:spermidine synthase [Virgisporangium ochraceum]GIJ72100.1 spermidine synthase [Virgisporangium ochraceum]